MTPEELASRMEKIRLQNEKIKERREVSVVLSSRKAECSFSYDSACSM